LFEQGRALIEGELEGAAASLRSLACARVVHQDLPHQLRCNPKKVCATLPLRQILSHHADIGFVNQGCTLQRVVGPLALQKMLGDVAKFLINQRHELVQGATVALSPADE